mmetsp:Transcript_14057/g.41174  ORF Transcript_14057/g.41174 Transcript_14057/m.41174 type:complete len:217 (-) Transcript_14057:342-992(-)
MSRRSPAERLGGFEKKAATSSRRRSTVSSAGRKQLLSSSSAAEGLASAGASIEMSSRTCASDTRSDHSRTRECTASAVTPVAAMAAICAYVTSSPKKGRPAKSSKRTRPADQMSSGGRSRTVACSEIESATASSGATYRREWQGVSDEPSLTAPPKSTSLSSPAPPNLMKWCGLMSQCTRPTSCTRASSCSTRCARAVSIRVDSPPPPPPPRCFGS